MWKEPKITQKVAVLTNFYNFLLNRFKPNLPRKNLFDMKRIKKGNPFWSNCSCCTFCFNCLYLVLGNEVLESTLFAANKDLYECDQPICVSYAFFKQSMLDVIINYAQQFVILKIEQTTASFSFTFCCFHNSTADGRIN